MLGYLASTGGTLGSIPSTNEKKVLYIKFEITPDPKIPKKRKLAISWLVLLTQPVWLSLLVMANLYRMPI